MKVKSWKHRWLHATDPMEAFQVWLDARWPHPQKGDWLLMAAKAYGQDEEVPRQMQTERPPMPDDPF